MKIKIAGSSIGDTTRHQFLMSYLVNDDIAIDAGSIGFLSPIKSQSAIKHVFISHSHVDHLGSLPIFLDNVYQPGPECPKVYGGEAVIECIKTDLFNERLWPDLVRLSTAETPFFEMEALAAEQPVGVGGIQITPIPLDHVVPTFGFLVEDAEGAVAIISDTAPTERIWQILNQCPNLRAVFLEASFPNELEWLAEKSMHLTPSLFHGEICKLKHEIPVIAVHIKPSRYNDIVDELNALGMPNVVIGSPEYEYEF